MSRRCGWTPARRSFPADASSRFWVLRSTPRPALEMYSSRLQSSVTVPSTWSRNAWAAGDWAASSRPDMTTVPAGPYSIASILFPPLSTMPAGFRPRPGSSGT